MLWCFCCNFASCWYLGFVSQSTTLSRKRLTKVLFFYEPAQLCGGDWGFREFLKMLWLMASWGSMLHKGILWPFSRAWPSLWLWSILWSSFPEGYLPDGSKISGSLLRTELACGGHEAAYDFWAVLTKMCPSAWVPERSWQSSHGRLSGSGRFTPHLLLQVPKVIRGHCFSWNHHSLQLAFGSFFNPFPFAQLVAVFTPTQLQTAVLIWLPACAVKYLTSVIICASFWWVSILRRQKTSLYFRHSVFGRDICTYTILYGNFWSPTIKPVLAVSCIFFPKWKMGFKDI